MLLRPLNLGEALSYQKAETLKDKEPKASKLGARLAKPVFSALLQTVVASNRYGGSGLLRSEINDALGLAR